MTIKFTKISPEHMKVLKDDLNVKDSRAFKEIVVFLIVFGEPLRKCLEVEIRGQGIETLEQCWNVACEIGGAFSEKLKAFGCVGFEANFLTWNYLASKHHEKVLQSYLNLLDSLLIAYGV